MPQLVHRGGSPWQDYPDYPWRILDRVLIWEDGCWTLDRVLGAGNAWKGEGGVPPVVRTPEGRQLHAYRWMWEFFHGPVVPPRVLCNRREICTSWRHCVNPGHWELVADRFEVSRRIVERTLGFDPQERCVRGHPREEFGYRAKDGRLRCRRCESDNRHAHRLARPDLAAASEERRREKKLAYMREYNKRRPPRRRKG